MKEFQFCESCGFQVLEKDNFCQKCGIKISKTTASFLGKYSNFTKVTIFLFLVIVFLAVLYVVKGKETTQSDLLSASSLDDETKLTKNNFQEKSEEWVEYDSVNGNFKILFPDWPTHDSEKGVVIEDSDDTYDYDIYNNGLPDGTEYAATVYQYSTEFDNEYADTILETFANGIKVASGGELIDSKYVIFKNNRAIDFLVFMKNDNSYYHGLFFLTDKDRNKMYHLAVMYKSENKSEVQFEKFSNSFTLK